MVMALPVSRALSEGQIVRDIRLRLDSASLDELRVIQTAIVRLEILRRATAAGTAELGRPWSALDEALRLELTDVQLERERDARPCTCGHDIDRHRAPGAECVVDGCACSTHIDLGGEG